MSYRNSTDEKKAKTDKCTFLRKSDGVRSSRSMPYYPCGTKRIKSNNSPALVRLNCPELNIGGLVTISGAVSSSSFCLFDI